MCNPDAYATECGTDVSSSFGLVDKPTIKKGWAAQPVNPNLQGRGGITSERITRIADLLRDPQIDDLISMEASAAPSGGGPCANMSGGPCGGR